MSPLKLILVLALGGLVPLQLPGQGPGCYGLLKFSEQLSPERRAEYATAGIVIFSQFEDSTYRVRIPRCSTRVPESVGTFVRLTPPDRVSEPIWNGRYDDFVVRLPNSDILNTLVNDDGTLNLAVTFYPTVRREQMLVVLRAANAQMQQIAENRWSVQLLPDSVPALAQSELIEWIDARPTRVVPEVEVTRQLLRVDSVQRFDTVLGSPVGLAGRGIRVGIFDAGIDHSHGDLQNRVVSPLRDEHYHGTHVAGIVAGGGNLSHLYDTWGAANGGSEYGWRGVAPLAELLEASLDWGDSPFAYEDSMHLSNHSYPVSANGAYDDENRVRDRLIRGDESGTRRVPPLLQVHSAGNNGEYAWTGAQIGYFSLSKQMKNALIVGNVLVVNDSIRISTTSSLGPTHDGRIKPDVVAPGTNVLSTGFCTSKYPLDEEREACVDPQTGAILHRNYYRRLSGTSMAAPAVTGVLALVLEQYVETFDVDLNTAGPLPSTLRGIVIHTATDIVSDGPWFVNEDAPVQAFPGPDFVTGWGMVNAEAAVKAVQSRAVIEGSLSTTCHAASYPLEVSAGGPLRVTLAWDDAGGHLPRRDAMAPVLVNDLDLLLIDPVGGVHRPWLLDQATELATAPNPDNPNERDDPLSNQAAGTPLPDSLRLCGVPVEVRRRVRPTTAPAFDSVRSAANQNDPIPDGALQPAGTGADHLNNVEQVFVEDPQAGRWTIWVLGFNIPEGPQPFSLIGIVPPPN